MYYYSTDEKDNLNSTIKVMICLSICVAIIFFYNDCLADDGKKNAIANVLCNIVKELNGAIGKGIATIAIIVLGIGLFLGKLSWGLAVATAIGVGMIFGAASLVEWVSGAKEVGEACNITKQT